MTAITRRSFTLGLSAAGAMVTIKPTLATAVVQDLPPGYFRAQSMSPPVTIENSRPDAVFLTEYPENLAALSFPGRFVEVPARPGDEWRRYEQSSDYNMYVEHCGPVTHELMEYVFSGARFRLAVKFGDDDYLMTDDFSVTGFVFGRDRPSCWPEVGSQVCLPDCSWSCCNLKKEKDTGQQLLDEGRV